MPTKTPPISNYEFAKVVLEKQNNKNFKKIINDILDLEIDSDNRYDMSECNTIIDNFLELGKALKRYKFFEKAGYVLDEVLTMAHDYDEFDDYNGDNWFAREQNLDPAETHYFEAKRKISEAIYNSVKTMDISKDTLKVLKPYIIPLYSKIKSIEIDKNIFSYINDAQLYLNMLMLEDPQNYLLDRDKCDIKIIIEDEYLAKSLAKVSDETDWELCINDCFDKIQIHFCEITIVEALLDCLDPREEFMNEIAKENGFSNRKDLNYYSFKHYKEDAIKLYSFYDISFKEPIDNNINADMDNFLTKYENTENLNEDLLELAFKVLLDSYAKDIETLQRLQEEMIKQYEIMRIHHIDFEPKTDNYLIRKTIENLNNTLPIDIYYIDYKAIDDLISYLVLKMELASSPYTLAKEYTFEENRKYANTLEILQKIKDDYKETLKSLK